MRITPQYEVSTIITPTKPDKGLIDEITAFMKTWPGIKLLGSKPLKGYLVMSSKAGPNGPATISALKDLNLIRGSNLEAPIKFLLSKTLSGLNLDQFKVDKSGRRHSKLVLLCDKAGKTRVVAISD